MILRFLIEVAAMLGAFAALEVCFRSLPGNAWQRKDARVDLAFLLTSALTDRWLIPTLAFCASGWMKAELGIPALSALGELPGWAQVALMLVGGDFLSYWVHRAYHRSAALWRVHAVHHSSRPVDFLSAMRLHPLDQLAHVGTRLWLFSLLGFSPELIAALGPPLGIYAVLIHANVSWGFGPLGYLIVSPAWHRGHHAADAFGEGRNFAGMFPLWDFLFGTARVSRTPPPDFGLRDESLSATFLGQLLHPFQRDGSH